MSAWLVNLGGVALMGLIVWWFWLSRPRARAAGAGGAVEILVDDGVYTPARVEVVAGRPVTLRFIRKDPSPCAEKVLFGELGISAELPLNEPVDVTITQPTPGEYDFTCQMQMYRGSLVVRPEG